MFAETRVWCSVWRSGAAGHLRPGAVPAPEVPGGGEPSSLPAVLRARARPTGTDRYYRYSLLPHILLVRSTAFSSCVLGPALLAPAGTGTLSPRTIYLWAAPCSLPAVLRARARSFGTDRYYRYSLPHILLVRNTAFSSCSPACSGSPSWHR